MSADGKALRPSYLIQELLRLYPDVKVRDEDEKELVQKELTEKTGVKYLIRGLQEKNLDVTWQELLYLVSERSKWKRKSRRTFNGMVLQTSGGSIVGKRCKATLR